MYIKRNYTDNLEENYQILLEELKALIHDEADLIANLANASALLNQFLTELKL